MAKILSKNFIVVPLILILSLILFRGRIGSDDLEVFNFVYNFKNFEGNLIDYLKFLRESDALIFADDVQKHTYYTWHHRLIWIVQTYIVYSIFDFINFFFQLNTLFFHKYMSGLILTVYTVSSFFLCIKYFSSKNLNLYSSFLLSSFIFFSTGLVTFLTGQYIESLAVLIIISRFYSKNLILIFILDFLLILIKPFYFLIVFFLRVQKLNLKKIFDKKNFEIFFHIGLLIILFILLRITITDTNSNLDYISSQYPVFVLSNYLKNLKEFYFSHGSGIFYTLLPLLILIFFGSNRQTILKLLCVILISLVLSIFDGHSGSVSGGRYSLPFFLIFLDEYLNGFKRISYQFKPIFILLSILTLLNLPSLEYRNFVISEYQNKTVISKKPKGPVELEIKDNQVTQKLFEWPINDFKFNNIIFSNIILYSKIFDKRYVKINNKLIFETDYIFPQTGLARLIYINDKNIDSGYKLLNNFSTKFSIYLKIIYYLFFLIFLILHFITIKKSLIQEDKHGKN